jgi:hypothetical protein
MAGGGVSRQGQARATGKPTQLTKTWAQLILLTTATPHLVAVSMLDAAVPPVR